MSHSCLGGGERDPEIIERCLLGRLFVGWGYVTSLSHMCCKASTCMFLALLLDRDVKVLNNIKARPVK